MPNIDLIKQRLSKLQSKGSNSEKIDYSTIFWKPKLGKQVVRIVPRKDNKDFPFYEISFHQYNAFKKSVYCLENFGEKDPVVQLVKELYSENTADSKALAGKIKPRNKYFAQVVVRGEESMGVRLWEFNKTTYEKLLTLMADEDFGNIEDIVSGTDLTLEGYNDTIKIGKKEVTYIAVNITPKRNTSPLTEDKTVLEMWLTNQKNILEVYKRYTYDEIKTMLKNYLDPKEESLEESEEEQEQPKTESVGMPALNNTATADDEEEDDVPFPVEPKKTSKADKFNQLFSDEEL
jgi:hypothetical protein